MVKKRRFPVALLVILFCVILPACSVNLIEPVTARMDTDTGTDSSTGMETDSTTITDDDTGTTMDTSTETGTETGDTETETDTFTPDAVFGIVGYATVDALDQDGTTGGLGDADPVLVTSGEQMQAAIDGKGDEPLIIHVDSRLVHDTGRVVISGKSNISIIGLSGSAELDAFGITITGSSNIIISNLRIHHVRAGDKDAVRIADQSHHIWLDHCELYNDGTEPADTTPYDSLLDISTGSDYVTVSWNYFHHHVKSMYVGAADGDTALDEGRLHITFHHNRFHNINIDAGMLSVRFGPVHMFNNFFETTPAVAGGGGTGVSSRMTACLRAEYNRFSGVAMPVRTDQSGDSLETLGAVELIGNDFGDYTTVSEIPTCVLQPPYDYRHTLNATADLELLLKENVGPVP